MQERKGGVKIYGLIGYPVKHSLSAKMHNAAFKELGIDARYHLFEVASEKLKSFLVDPDARFNDINGQSFRAGDVVGFNITIPHKVEARKILEEEFPFEVGDMPQVDLYYVKLSGAVNTVRRDGSELKYCNTDATGFRWSLKTDLEFDIKKEKTVLIIGCGGAARAIIASLSWKDYNIKKIYVYEVNDKAIESAKEHFSKLSDEWQRILAEKFEFVLVDQISSKINECQLLVNATPVGMKEGDPSVIDKKLLHEGLSVYDVVYNKETQLIKDAKSLGLPAKIGDGMLLYQGVDAFNFWTGERAPVKIMREALDVALKA
ncbi:MAG TPA: shikimate dehydrogenase [Candidatus Omnitrophica bacterium]|nr:shikimate dehydrogenase [Candidatus Omnitrophota bacterium]